MKQIYSKLRGIILENKRGIILENKKSRTTNSLINVATSFGSQLFMAIAQFACRTVFIQVLGKDYLGINGLFSNILTLLSLTELGFDVAINYKLYKPLKNNDHQRIRILMKFYKIVYILVGIAILSLGLLLIPFLPYLVSDYDTFSQLGINPVVVFILYLLQSASSYLFFASRSVILKADQKSYITTTVTCICTVALNILQIITLLIWKDFMLYTVLFIAANIIINFINAVIAKRQYKYAFEKTDENITKEEVRNIFKDIGALFIFRVDNVVLKATDNIVLSSFVGLSIVGLYSNYLVFYTTITGLLRKVYSGVKASMGNLYAGSDIDKRYKFFEITNYITFVISSVAAIGVAVCADELIQCWIGSEYVIAQPFSILMGVELLFAGLKQNLNLIRNITGAFRQMWYRPLIGIIINITVSITGVKIWSINGVLVGTIAAIFFANILIDPKIIHKISLEGYRPVSEYYKRNGMYLAVAVVVFIIDKFACTYILSGYGWLSVIAHIIICGLSVPVIFCLVFWRRHECQYVIGICKRFSKKIVKH